MGPLVPTSAVGSRETLMPRLITVIEIWVALNLAIPALIAWQRSPHFRHRVFRWTIGGLTPLRERQLAHALVDAARQHR